MLEHGTITTGAVHHAAPASCRGARRVVGGDRPEAATSARVSSTRKAQPWLKPALGARTALREGPVDDGRVDRLVGVVADHPAAAYDVLELHAAACESCLTTSSRCGRDLAPVGPVGAPAAATSASRSPRAERELRGVVRRAVRGPRASASRRDGIGNLRRVVGARAASDGPARSLTGSHLDSVLDGGAYDGPLGVVSALAAVDLLRERGVVPARPIGVVGVRRGGGVAVRAGLPGLAAGHRGDRPGRGPRAARPGRRTPAGRDGRRRARAGARPSPGWTGIGCFVELHVEQGRDLVDRGARGRRGQRDLAARALPLRLRRRGQPRRHHADGGPRTTRCSPTR